MGKSTGSRSTETLEQRQVRLTRARDWISAYRAERKALGLCYRCNKPARSTLCEDHRKDQTRRDAERERNGADRALSAEKAAALLGLTWNAFSELVKSPPIEVDLPSPREGLAGSTTSTYTFLDVRKIRAEINRTGLSKNLAKVETNQSITYWSSMTGIPRSTLMARMRRQGITVEEAASQGRATQHEDYEANPQEVKSSER